MKRWISFVLGIIKNALRAGYSVDGSNNHIYIVDGQNRTELKGKIPGLVVLIEGNNNTVTIERPCNFANTRIRIQKNDSEVYISSTVHCIMNTYIEMKLPNNFQRLYIGKNVSIGGANIFMYGNDAELLIGDNCLFSNNIVIMTGDGHRIYDNTTGETLNQKKQSNKIGNHVWLGRGAVICKNVQIPDNSIVGAFSVVTKSPSAEETNVVIAGNPAKIVKKNINWDDKSNF